MNKKKKNYWSQRFAALAMALMVMIPMMTGCTKPKNGDNTSKKPSASQTDTQRKDKKKKDKDKNKQQQNNRPGSQKPEEKKPGLHSLPPPQAGRLPPLLPIRLLLAARQTRTPQSLTRRRTTRELTPRRIKRRTKAKNSIKKSLSRKIPSKKPPQLRAENNF